jgi:hypothetical protein
VGKFFGTLQKYQHKEPLEGLATPGTTIEEFWQNGNKDYMEFEYGKPLVQKQVHVNCRGP